jgi:hypothetical protein
MCGFLFSVQVIAALESWARPIKEAALRAAEAEPGPAGNGQVRLRMTALNGVCL